MKASASGVSMRYEYVTLLHSAVLATNELMARIVALLPRRSGPPESPNDGHIMRIEVGQSSTASEAELRIVYDLTRCHAGVLPVTLRVSNDD